MKAKINKNHILYTLHMDFLSFSSPLREKKEKQKNRNGDLEGG